MFFGWLRLGKIAWLGKVCILQSPVLFVFSQLSLVLLLFRIQLALYHHTTLSWMGFPNFLIEQTMTSGPQMFSLLKNIYVQHTPEQEMFSIITTQIHYSIRPI